MIVRTFCPAVDLSGANANLSDVDFSTEAHWTTDCATQAEVAIDRFLLAHLSRFQPRHLFGAYTRSQRIIRELMNADIEPSARPWPRLARN